MLPKYLWHSVQVSKTAWSPIKCKQLILWVLKVKEKKICIVKNVAYEYPSQWIFLKENVHDIFWILPIVLQHFLQVSILIFLIPFFQ